MELYTKTQLLRMTQFLNSVVDKPSIIDGECITVEKLNNTIFIFCNTELGMYRIVNHYKSMFDQLNYGYTYNSGKWCVSFDI